MATIPWAVGPPGPGWAGWLYQVVEALGAGPPTAVPFQAVRSTAAAVLRGVTIRFVGFCFPEPPAIEPGATLDAHPDLEVDLDNSGVVLLVQEVTMAATFIAFFLAVSYAILARYAKPPDREPDTRVAVLYAEDSSAVPFLCSIFGLGVSIAGSLLVPSTILATHLQATVADTWLGYYFTWLTPGLIYGLWDATFWGHCLGVFLVVPFGFFWSQAVGGLLTRLVETLATVAVVAVLHSVSHWLLWSVLPAPAGQPDVPASGPWVLPFSFSFISLCGSALLLVFTPRGRTELFLLVWRLRRPLNVSPHALHAAEFELQRLALRLRHARRRCLHRLARSPQLSALLALAHIHAIDDLQDLTAPELRRRLERVVGDLAAAVAEVTDPKTAPLFCFTPVAQSLPNPYCPACHKAAAPATLEPTAVPPTEVPAVEPSSLVRSLWAKLGSATPAKLEPEDARPTPGFRWLTPRPPASTPPPPERRTPPRVQPTLAIPIHLSPDLPPARRPTPLRSPTPPPMRPVASGHGPHRNGSFSRPPPLPQRAERFPRASSASTLEVGPTHDHPRSRFSLLALRHLPFLPRPPSPPRSAAEDGPAASPHALTLHPAPTVELDGRGVRLNGQPCLAFPLCSHHTRADIPPRPEQSPAWVPAKSEPPPPSLLSLGPESPLQVRHGPVAALQQSMGRLVSALRLDRRLLPSFPTGHRFNSRQSTSSIGEEMCGKGSHTHPPVRYSPTTPSSPSTSFSHIDFLLPMGNSAAPSFDGRTMSDLCEPVTLADVQEATASCAVAVEPDQHQQLASLQDAVRRRWLQLACQDMEFFATPVVSSWLQRAMGLRGPAGVSAELHRIVAAAQQELAAQRRFLGFDPARHLPPQSIALPVPATAALDGEVGLPPESDEDVLGQLREHHQELRRLRATTHPVRANLLCLLSLALCLGQLALSALFLADACLGGFRRQRGPSGSAAGLDALLVGSFLGHAVLGLYSTPGLRWLTPTPRGTPTPLLLLNIFLLLMMSASLPLVAHLLGLTSFDLMGHYSQTTFLSSESMHRWYCALYILSELCRLYAFWRDTLFRSSYKAMLEHTKGYLKDLREQIGNDLGIATGLG